MNWKEMYMLLKIRYLLAKGALLIYTKPEFIEKIEDDKLDLEKDELKP
jgi:DNA-dependent RNA polymerase auxiliary subunit epsilon